MEFRDKPMQNLIRIKEKEICKNVQALLLDGETIVGAYKTVRDQAVFTSHRIFLVVCFADEHEAKFGFIGQDELLNVARAISRCIL